MQMHQGWVAAGCPQREPASFMDFIVFLGIFISICAAILLLPDDRLTETEVD